jgi:cob(I)alamin adenosyltransferase
MKIYTKVGDKGETSLYDGSRVCKDHVIVDCLGDLDELNSELGCVLASLTVGNVELIRKTQSVLFEMGSLIAYPSNKKKKTFDDSGELTAELEVSIDWMTGQMPKLSNFILPGGNVVMSAIHKARTVCRRVERKMVALKTNDILIDPKCYVYINRLSDFLFTMARYVGHVSQIPEIIYKAS